MLVTQEGTYLMTTVLCKSLINNEDRVVSQLMSTRLVNCASVLENGSKLGWKMVVPKEGLVSISLFGIDGITKNDLEYPKDKGDGAEYYSNGFKTGQ